MTGVVVEIVETFNVVADVVVEVGCLLEVDVRREVDDRREVANVFGDVWVDTGGVCVAFDDVEVNGVEVGRVEVEAGDEVVVTNVEVVGVVGPHSPQYF